MPTYIALMSWTDQGVKSFRDSVDRAEAAEDPFLTIGIVMAAGTIAATEPVAAITTA